MRPLTKKLWRDVWRLRGQVIAIAMVVASGVATLVMALSTVEALRDTTQAYYERYQFADIFAQVKRAPEALERRIRAMEGVQFVETRISQMVSVDVSDFAEPTIGLVNSLPDGHQSILNQLVLRKGQWIDATHHNQIIINEPFAEAHQLDIGDTVSLLLNGNKKRFTVTGIALSPEYIYALGPGALLPDDKRFGIFWLNRDALAAAFDLKQAFNSVSLKLLANADAEALQYQLDRILEPFGGQRSILKKDQLSNWFVMNEIEQQKSMATILPGIFLAVSVFLTHMVLSRLIATERTEIGLLKAFGYSNWQIAFHYTKFVLMITLLGVIIGWLFGSIFGRYNTEIYQTLFRFPLLIYRPSMNTFAAAGCLYLVASVVGGLSAVKSAVKLPAAQAMIPPSPPVYKHSSMTDSAWFVWLDQPTRIAIRQISRWPIRSLMTSCGMSFSVGLIVLTLQWTDSLTHMTQVYFSETQRQDLVIGLAEAKASRAQYDIKHLPGIRAVEPIKYASVEFSSGHLTHRGSITGVSENSQLQPIYDDAKQQSVEIPKNGIVLSKMLAEKLEVSPGDQIWLNFLTGKQKKVMVVVADIIETFIGMPAYIHTDSLDRLLQQSPRLEYASVLVDKEQLPALYSALKSTPQLGSLMIKESAQQSFEKTLIEHISVFVSVFIFFAATLGFGIAYNSTRIALSERGRELATLRVLGFSKPEISYILLGEVMLLIIFALPLGCLVGWFLVLSMAQAFETELFRIPMFIEPSTYGMAMLIVLVASVFSAALVRRRVNQLDLIRVLKTRE